MITAKELFDKMLQENDEATSTEMMIEFAKLHVKEALKKAKENVSLKPSSSEEINDKNISPFITADDETIWIIDEKSILDSYSLDNFV